MNYNQNYYNYNNQYANNSNRGFRSNYHNNGRNYRNGNGRDNNYQANTYQNRRDGYKQENSGQVNTHQNHRQENSYQVNTNYFGGKPDVYNNHSNNYNQFKQTQPWNNKPYFSGTIQQYKNESQDPVCKTKQPNPNEVYSFKATHSYGETTTSSTRNTKFDKEMKSNFEKKLTTEEFHQTKYDRTKLVPVKKEIITKDDDEVDNYKETSNQRTKIKLEKVSPGRKIDKNKSTTEKIFTNKNGFLESETKNVLNVNSNKMNTNKSVKKNERMIKAEADEDNENDSDNTSCVNKTNENTFETISDNIELNSQRCTRKRKIVPKVMLDKTKDSSESDVEEDVKKIIKKNNKSKKRKIESSDDEYVPEEFQKTITTRKRTNASKVDKPITKVNKTTIKSEISTVKSKRNVKSKIKIENDDMNTLTDRIGNNNIETYSPEILIDRNKIKYENETYEQINNVPETYSSNIKMGKNQIENRNKIKKENVDNCETIESEQKPKRVRKTITKRVKRKQNIKNEISDVEIKEEDLDLEEEIDQIDKDDKRLAKNNKTTTNKSSKVKPVGDKIKTETSTKSTTKRTTKRKAEESESTSNLEKKTIKKLKTNISNQTYWTDESLLADHFQCDKYIAWNFIRLIESDNTIPFIARYRKEMVNNYEPEKLREMKQFYENIKEIRSKAEMIINKIDKLGKLTCDLKKSILCCKSLEELDLVYSPFKVGFKGTKAEKAKKLGLELPALSILNGDTSNNVNLEALIDTNNSELNSFDKVYNGIQYIIADIIAKDTSVLEKLQELIKKTFVALESTKTKEAETIDQYYKYENYFQFSCNIQTIKPHAVLAINRGESQKVLSVNIKFNDWLPKQLYEFCKNKWLNKGTYSSIRKQLIESSFEDSFKRLIKPFMCRNIRQQLNQNAEIASIQVFASNLKQLLLVPPVHGSIIMAIDPGFTHGCKTAVIDVKGNVILTETLYINFKKTIDINQDCNALILRDIILKNKCELIAIGNGKACRETTQFISDLIKNKCFSPLNVRYTIVNEQGASIYSCSDEAKKEFPNMNPNLVSAISLARRLQDPLSELVKIEPKHIGVGMYQHDLQEKKLMATLNDVVSECVSFVGVDINCASHVMLRKIAGLTDATAKNIIDYRNEKGCFKSREELKKVKGIGDKRFEQCAGFVRISFTENDHWDINPLDSTWIHPESYDTVYKFAKNAKINLKDLGTDGFISNVNNYLFRHSLESLAAEYQVSEMTLTFIIEALKQPKSYDLRNSLSKPLFKTGITTLDDIEPGTLLTGKVNNITHFGCFVDVGLEKDALLHTSKMNGIRLKLNDDINVKVSTVERSKLRVGLEFVSYV